MAITAMLLDRNHSHPQTKNPTPNIVSNISPHRNPQHHSNTQDLLENDRDNQHQSAQSRRRPRSTTHRASRNNENGEPKHDFQAI
jgi:hypothetical protein